MSQKLSELKVTAADLAGVVGLSDRHVRNLAADGTITAGEDGKFVLTKAVQSYCKRLRSRSEKPTIVAARRRKLEAEAELAELSLAEKQGRVMNVDELDQRLRPMFLEVRNVILASSMDVEEKKALFDSLSSRLEHAFTRKLEDSQPTSAQEA